MMQIPSPITPNFAHDGPFPPVAPQNSSPNSQKLYFPPLHKDENGAPLDYTPLLAEMHSFAYPALNPNEPQYLPAPTAASASSTPPVSAPAPGPLASPAKLMESRASSTKQQSKKNQYPCPMAAQFNCPDYFTTSGHAARHAKKHTGRKDAICPECSKAFTRKDNMEQHRRTHQSGRATKKSSDSSDSALAATPSKVTKRPRPFTMQRHSVAAVVAAAVVDAPLIEPMQQPTSPGSAIAFSDAAALSQEVAAMPQPLPNFASPYIEPEPYRYDAAVQGTFTAGLDTLATAATDAERKRKYGD